MFLWLNFEVEDKEIQLKLFPEKKSFLDMLPEKGPDSSEEKAVYAAAACTLKAVQPLFGLVKELGLANNLGVLFMQEVEVK